MMTNLLLKLGTQDMFTGIVKGKGTLIAVEDSVNFRTYTIQFPSGGR